MQVVSSPSQARSLLLPPVTPTRPQPGATGAAAFARSQRSAAPTVAADDVIDVEVLWEDNEDRSVPGGYRTAVMGTGGAPLAALRITSPAQAAYAYRSAASTSTQPHSLIDLFA